jgi:hypothetical protein
MRAEYSLFLAQYSLFSTPTSRLAASRNPFFAANSAACRYPNCPKAPKIPCSFIGLEVSRLKAAEIR